MEDSGMLLHLVDGSLPQVEDLFDEHDNLGELAAREDTSEGGVSNAILAKSLSASDMGAARVIAVSLEVSVPDISQFQLSGHLTDFTSTLLPVVSSSLEQPGGILLDLTNSTTLDSNGTSVWSSEEVGAVLIISLMVPFILLSNILVILCVVRYRRLRTPTNYFITSLAAVDIFVALATPFVVVVEVFRFSNVAGAGDVLLCLLPNRILMMGCGVSVLTLAAIAYDRHTALVSPLVYVNIMTTRRVSLMVLLSWLYSVVIVWLPLLVGWYYASSDMSPCTANRILGKAPVLFLGAIFVPSCVAIIICYFRILMVARQHVKAIAAFEFAVHRRVRVKCLMRETKCLKTLALIIGVFLLLWLPYLILIFLKTVSSIQVNVWLQTYLILLAVLNSGINPWMYAFMNSELRSAFKRLIRDIFGDRLCSSTDRRSSVVSAVSSTPRLSLTDSRAVSIIPDASLDFSTDPFKKRPELCVERQPVSELCVLRTCDPVLLTEITAPSLFAEWNYSRKQELICSHLGTAKSHGESSLTRPKSFNSDLTGNLPPLDVLDNRVLNKVGSYHQICGPVASAPETLDSLKTATCRRDNAASSPRESTVKASFVQPRTSLLSQNTVHVSSLLRPSSPPGCVQTDHHNSLSSTSVFSPAAFAQVHRPESLSPTSSCHLHSIESTQPSSPYARLSDRPQTQPQASPTAQVSGLCTSCPTVDSPYLQGTRQPCDRRSPHRPQPPAESEQTSAQCRHCSLPGQPPSQTSAEYRTSPSPDPSPLHTSAEYGISPSPDASPPQTSDEYRRSPSPDSSPPQTSAEYRISPSPDPFSLQTSTEYRISPSPDPFSLQTSTEYRISPSPDPSPSQTSAEYRPCPAADACRPLAPPHRQFPGMFSDVSAYSFLLPLCETLALDVISTAARLETCMDLARLTAGEHTILIH